MDEPPYMEPVILIDQTNRQNKQAHLLIDAEQDFEYLLGAGQRLYPKLFQGQWNMSYLDPNTQEVKRLQADQTPADFIAQGIDTFFWNYQTSHQTQNRYRRSRSKRNRSKTNPFKSFYTDRPRTNSMTYGSFRKRVVATLIDMVAITLLCKMIGFGLAIFVPWLYYAILESSATKATIGKMAMNMQVVDKYGEKLDFKQASWRFFAKILTSFTFVFGYLLVLITPKKQALHDILSGSVVVDSNSVVMDAEGSKERNWSGRKTRRIKVN